jgi:hypothetical protein
MLFLLRTLAGIPLGGKNLGGRLRTLVLRGRGSGRGLLILPWLAKLLPLWELSETNSLLVTLFPTIITEELL